MQTKDFTPLPHNLHNLSKSLTLKQNKKVCFARVLDMVPKRVQRGEILEGLWEDKRQTVMKTKISLKSMLDREG